MIVAGKVVIDAERCKACGLCIHVCPRKIIGLGETANTKGYYAVEIREPEQCTGCAFCALVCPDVALTVYRTKKEGSNP